MSWPRGRQPLSQPRGRGTGIADNYQPNYPPILGFNQYPQPQQGPMPGFRSQPQHYNNKPNKRDRVRPRQQGYSFYSDESVNSNYSQNSSRGGAPNYSNNAGSSRESYTQSKGGIINAAIRNLPRPPLNDNRRNSNDGEQDQVPSRFESNRNSYFVARERTNSQNKENRIIGRGRREVLETEQHRMYFCPKCGENYSYRQTQNRYIGKIPLILHCSHTICQECVYQNLKNLKINCPTCHTDSVLTQEETPVCQTDMQNVFHPNFFIIGVISYYRPQGGYLGNLDNIKFVSTVTKRPQTLVIPSDQCNFATCSKLATMYCPSCEGIYCVDCCTVVHKSTKKLMSHEPVPRRKETFSLLLENCGEHPQMKLEFFCQTCDLSACCYCLLDNHPDHERVPLFHLNETEMDEFKRLIKGAEKALREVLRTQRKAARLANFNTGSVKKDVCQYFADLYAKIEGLEKKMLDELDTFKSNNRGLEAVQSSLTSSAEQLKQLIAFNIDKIGDKKLNLRGGLEKLRNIDKIPRFLLNENGSSEPIRFVVRTDCTDALDLAFGMEKCEDSEYKLVVEKDLPDDYVADHDETDSEVDGNCSVIVDDSNKSEDLLNSLPKFSELPKMVSANSESSKRVQKHTLPVEPKKRGLDMQRVDVQHINSMDSFFIQHKSNQMKLVQMNKDIENYVKMGAAQPVEQPHLNDLYLAHYVTESLRTQKEQRWCRARLTDIKNSESGPLYEMFFIDYGKTQTVDGSRIKDLPSFLAQKRPFAVECMLHNPMSVNWSKKAHFSLAKILNGKDVYMIEKSLNCGIHEVDLMIASSDGGITSVTDLLVHAHQTVEPRSDDNLSLDGSVRKEGYYPTLKVFPNSKKFVKNQKEKVTIANVVDPYNIFVHLVQFQDSFKNMTRSIKKAYKSSKASRCIPIEGTYVLVEYKDAIRSNWHRAFVKSVDINSDKVHVLLVDWGINVVVPTLSIKPLQECFTKLECQAVVVKLAHIAPYNAQATWSPHAVSFLQVFHQAQDVLKMVVQDVEDGAHVALFDITGNVDLCLNAMMVENNLADSTGPISSKLQWPQYDMQNPVFLEEEGLMASMMKKVDDEAVGDSEEDDSGVKKRQVDVVKVDAPDRIWIKFLEFRERESAMFKDLQIHYSQEQITKNRWNVDDQCVVEVEHEFNRGKILEELDGDYKVYLLDKAKEITVPLERIYVYGEYFQKYPQFVYKSHLANIKAAGDSGKWSQSSIEALQEIFAKHRRIFGNKAPESETDPLKKSLPLDMWYAHVIHGGALEPDRTKYVSINNFLVKLGFAYKVPRPMTPKPSTSKTEPVKAENSGDYLLKVLTGQINLTEKETSIKDYEKKSCATEAIVEEKEIEEGSSSYSEKTEESSKSKKPDEKDDTDDKNVKKDWISIVEEELGAPSLKDGGGSGDESEENEEEGSPYHRREEVVFGWPPPLRLAKKDFRARVTCVETSGHMFIHDETVDAVYYKMEANIKAYFENNPPKVGDRPWQWEPDQLCTIKYTDGNWYRGKIIRVKKPNEISVLMIDWGSDHDLSPDMLFREVLYTDMATFATKVKLHKVYPKSGTWLSSDYDHFLELVTDWCRIIVKGSLDVDLPLVEVYNDKGVFVNQKLTELCPNLSRCSNFPVDEELDDEDMVVIESIEHEQPFADQVINMLMINVEKELDRKIPQPCEDSAAIIYKGSLKYKTRPLPQDLFDGKKVLLEIGGVLNYDKVALKMPGESVSEEMYDLVIELQDAVDELPFIQDFKVGLPCLAPFSEDGVWYRARISSIRAINSGLVEVIFVDYGNSEEVSVEKVRLIRPDYLQLPQQTWEVALNIALKEDADFASVMQVLNALDRKKRYVKVVKKDPLTVDIYEQNDDLSYQPLIDSGFVEACQ